VPGDTPFRKLAHLRKGPMPFLRNNTLVFFKVAERFAFQGYNFTISNPQKTKIFIDFHELFITDLFTTPCKTFN